MQPGFLSGARVDAVRRAVDLAWADRSVHNPLTISAYTGTADYVETFLRNVDPAARARSYKLNHLYLRDPNVLDVLLGDDVVALATALLGGTPLLFNGLNMERGTEPRFHFDTFYMPPRVEGRMVAFWFALEDVKPGAGELQYYPGSHAIPPDRFSHGGLGAVNEEMDAFDRYIDVELAKRKLEPVRFVGNRGDVFVWHGQLYHGGSPIEDQAATRASMVAHDWCAEYIPEETVHEVRPGRFMLERRFMCEPMPFDPRDRARTP